MGLAMKFFNTLCLQLVFLYAPNSASSVSDASIATSIKTIETSDDQQEMFEIIIDMALEDCNTVSFRRLADRFGDLTIPFSFLKSSRTRTCPQMLQQLAAVGLDRVNAPALEADAVFGQHVKIIADEAVAASIMKEYLIYQGHVASISPMIILVLEDSIRRGRHQVAKVIVNSNALIHLRREPRYWENLTENDVYRRLDARELIANSLPKEHSICELCWDYKAQISDLVAAERSLYKMELPFLIDLACKMPEKKAKRLYETCLELMAPTITPEAVQMLLKPAVKADDPFFLEHLLEFHRAHLKKVLLTLINEKGHDTNVAWIDVILRSGYKLSAKEAQRSLEAAIRKCMFEVISRVLIELDESTIASLTGVIGQINFELDYLGVSKEEYDELPKKLQLFIHVINKFKGTADSADEILDEYLVADESISGLQPLDFGASAFDILDRAHKLVSFKRTALVLSRKYQELAKIIKESHMVKEQYKSSHMLTCTAIQDAFEKTKRLGYAELHIQFKSLLESAAFIPSQCNTLHECRTLRSRLVVLNSKCQAAQDLRVKLQYQQAKSHIQAGIASLTGPKLALKPLLEASLTDLDSIRLNEITQRNAKQKSDAIQKIVEEFDSTLNMV